LLKKRESNNIVDCAKNEIFLRQVVVSLRRHAKWFRVCAPKNFGAVLVECRLATERRHKKGPFFKLVKGLLASKVFAAITVIGLEKRSK